MKTRIYTHNMFGHFPCVLCGERHDQNLVAAELLFDKAIENDWSVMRDVCPNCLEAGARGAADRARDHAAELRVLADNLDVLAGEVEKIAPADWAKPEELIARYEMLEAEIEEMAVNDGGYH